MNLVRLKACVLFAFKNALVLMGATVVRNALGGDVLSKTLSVTQGTPVSQAHAPPAPLVRTRQRQAREIAARVDISLIGPLAL